jgi:hypothetical protein
VILPGAGEGGVGPASRLLRHQLVMDLRERSRVMWRGCLLPPSSSSCSPSLLSPSSCSSSSRRTGPAAGAFASPRAIPVVFPAEKNIIQNCASKPRLRIRIHFIWIRIRFQHFRLYADPDPDPIRIQCFDDPKFKKMTAEKKFIFWGIKNYNLPTPKPP